MLEFKPEMTYGDLTAAGIGVIAMLVLGLLSFLYSQILQSAGDRADLIAALRRGYVRGLYQGAVNWLMRGLQKLYGNAESWQAFNVSFLLSYLYPLLFFVLSYSYFEGTNLFSGKELLPADSPYRPYFFPGLLLFAVVMFVTMKFFVENSDKADVWGKAQLQRLGLPSTVADHTWRVLMGMIAALFSWFYLSSGSVGWAVVWFGLGYWSVAFAVTVAVTVAVTFAGAFAVAFAVVVAGAGAGAGAGAVIWGVITAWDGDYNTSLMLAFFYLALPLVNALLDWLSWWVSRWFLARTAQEPRVRVIVLDVVLDFGMAVLFMLTLCLLLPAGAMALDSLYAGWVDVKTGVAAQTNWQEYAVWARDDPWGKGIMVTLMLVTTLIPTLLHILLGLMAFFIHGFKGAALADFLEQPRKNWRDAVVSVWMFGYVLMAVSVMWALWRVFQHFAQLPIAQWLYNFTGYFYELQ